MNADYRIQRIFSAQHGLATAADAAAAGLTTSQVKQRVRSGRWERLARGVYRLQGVPTSAHQRLMAFVLAGSPGTVASHLSAAWLKGALARPPRPQITVPRGSRVVWGRVTVHWGTLARGERSVVAGIPCTSAARTAVDCAVVLTQQRLGEVVDALVCDGLTSPERIEQSLTRASRAPGRAGAAKVREVLRLWTDPIQPESRAEVRLLRRLAEWGFPIPEMQFVVRDSVGRFVARVDLAWAAQRVGLEYDGAQWHGPRRLEHDETRHASVEAAGWRLVRADRIDLAAGNDELRHRLSPLLSQRCSA